jgi:hypothetical protein
MRSFAVSSKGRTGARVNAARMTSASLSRMGRRSATIGRATILATAVSARRVRWALGSPASCAPCRSFGETRGYPPPRSQRAALEDGERLHEVLASAVGSLSTLVCSTATYQRSEHADIRIPGAAAQAVRAFLERDLEQADVSVAVDRAEAHAGRSREGATGFGPARQLWPCVRRRRAPRPSAAGARSTGLRKWSAEGMLAPPTGASPHQGTSEARLRTPRPEPVAAVRVPLRRRCGRSWSATWSKPTSASA